MCVKSCAECFDFALNSAYRKAMTVEVLRTIINGEGTRKVEIFRCSDGTFGFEELEWLDAPREHCWVPFGKYSIARIDTLEHTLREVEGRVSWVAK